MAGDDSARAESRLLIRGEFDDRIGPFVQDEWARALRSTVPIEYRNRRRRR
jgi:hypothetical protein